MRSSRAALYSRRCPSRIAARVACCALVGRSRYLNVRITCWLLGGAVPDCGPNTSWGESSAALLDPHVQLPLIFGSFLRYTTPFCRQCWLALLMLSQIGFNPTA